MPFQPTPNDHQVTHGVVIVEHLGVMDRGIKRGGHREGIGLDFLSGAGHIAHDCPILNMEITYGDFHRLCTFGLVVDHRLPPPSYFVFFLP